MVSIPAGSYKRPPLSEVPLTMLERLAKARVFTLYASTKGGFVIEEDCDNYFHLRLTREELVKLGEEIIAAANN